MLRRLGLLVLVGIALVGALATGARADRLLDGAVTGGDLEVYDAIGYRRGRPMKIEVVTIGWAEVEVKTAKAFLAMQRAAAADGVELYIRSGFRRHENQVWLYQAWREGWGNKAARPGFSNHQSGRALDLYVGDPAIRQWLDEHARRFGFQRTVAGEPWHWEYAKRPPRRKAARHARTSRPAARSRRGAR